MTLSLVTDNFSKARPAVSHSEDSAMIAGKTVSAQRYPRFGHVKFPRPTWLKKLPRLTSLHRKPQTTRRFSKRDNIAQRAPSDGWSQQAGISGAATYPATPVRGCFRLCAARECYGHIHGRRARLQSLHACDRASLLSEAGRRRLLQVLLTNHDSAASLSTTSQSARSVVLSIDSQLNIRSLADQP